MQGIFLTLTLALTLCAACSRKEEPAKQPAALDQPAVQAKPAPMVPKQFVGSKTSDPVCSMDVHVKADTPFSVHGAEHLFFCCQDCKEMFDLNPDKYLKKKE